MIRNSRKKIEKNRINNHRQEKRKRKVSENLGKNHLVWWGSHRQKIILRFKIHHLKKDKLPWGFLNYLKFRWLILRKIPVEVPKTIKKLTETQLIVRTRWYRKWVRNLEKILPFTRMPPSYKVNILRIKPKTKAILQHTEVKKMNNTNYC